MDLLAFAAVLAVGQFSPGPDMVLLTQISLRHGRAAGWWATLGITTGLTVHGTVVLFAWELTHGLPEAARAGLAGLAAAYLGWLAWRIWKDRHHGDGPDPTPIEARRWYWRGLLCNLLNPKALVFFAALVAPFLGPHRPGWWPFALWSILVFEGLLLWGLWVRALQYPKARRAYLRAAPFINGGFAILLAALACVLVLGLVS